MKSVDTETNVWTRVETFADRRAVVVWVWGEVDHLTIESFRWAIDQGFGAATAFRPARPDPRPFAPFEVLVLDLAGVTFFGSLGLIELLQARERATEGGMRLVVTIPPGHPIGRVTRMTEVDQDVELAVSVDQALGRPRQGRHHRPGPG